MDNMDYLGLCIGDEIIASDDFSRGFVGPLSKKMSGRKIFVSRLFSVMALYGDGLMIEFDFLPPTSRHKAFKKSFSVFDVKRFMLRGQIEKAEVKKSNDPDLDV